MRESILVSDFDGTLTRHDFYQLARELLIPSNSPNFWEEYRTGRMTHFAALAAYFAEIRVDEAQVHLVVDRMDLAANLDQSLARLRTAGWRVIVASAGCDWYIRRLLRDVREPLEIHANPGHFDDGRGLIMEPPTNSPYFSPTLGVDKAGIVQQALNAGKRVAFIGDGFPDFEAAKLVPDHLRFAKNDLAMALHDAGLSYRVFEEWSEIVPILTNEAAT